MVAVLLGVVGTPASAQTVQVSVEDGPGAGTFTTLSTVEVFDDSGNTPAQTYNYTNFGYGGSLVSLADSTTQLFLVRNSDGNLHLYVVNGDGDAGDAEVQLDLTGPNAAGVFSVEVEDDPITAPPPDVFGNPAMGTLTADWAWNDPHSDGGVFGPLDDPAGWTLDFQFTAQASGITAVSVVGDGGSVAIPGLDPTDAGDVGVRIRLSTLRELNVTKSVAPTGAEGQFDLLLDGVLQVENAESGDGFTAMVPVGDSVTISELAGDDTDLADFISSISCSGEGISGTVQGTSRTFIMPPGSDAVDCTINNFEGTPGPSLMTCTATAVPPVVRAEGIAELTGDIVLTCTASGGIPSQPYIVTNVSTSLNVNITNNIDFGAGDDITDAVLVINENNCDDPASFGSVTDCGPDPRFQDPQFGRLAANNRLEWNEVAIPFPGADPDGADPIEPFPDVTTLRITSVRGNASQLGVPGSATFPSTQITSFVSITGPATVPVTNNVLNVAVPILGLIVDVDAGINGLQCIEDSQTAYIELTEGFATSFKTIGVGTFTTGQTQWESGYYAPDSNNGGGASQGTRFLLRFFNIPAGVDVSVPNYINCEGSTVQGLGLQIAYVSGADADGQGGFFTESTSGDADVSISGGFGRAVYEVINGNPFRNEECRVPITVSWTPDTANDEPGVGSGQVSASFAPISTVTTASLSEAEPRFIDTGGDPEPFVNIARCTTTLLFPFVTNQSGFDTGMAISNTSEDWLGTEPQEGACTLHYHGETLGGGAAPADQTSTVIPAGEQLIYTLSGGNPGQNIEGGPEFQGYIIAVCEFQYAHGFAFITDGFGSVPALAQGYLALVIPYDGFDRVAGVPCTGGYCEDDNLHEFGEALGQ